MEAAVHSSLPLVLAAVSGEGLGFVPTGQAVPEGGVQQPLAPALSEHSSAVPESKSQFYQHFVEGDEDNDDEGETRCICGETPDDHDGIMIQCEDCHCWQHGICVGIPDVDSCPERYYCEACRPEQHPYKPPSKPKARNRRNGNQNALSSLSSSTTNAPRKRRSLSEDHDGSSPTEPADVLAPTRLRNRASNSVPTRKCSQRRGSVSKAGESDGSIINSDPIALSVSHDFSATQLPVPGGGSSLQRAARRNSCTKSPRNSPFSVSAPLQAADEVVPMAEVVEPPMDFPMPEPAVQAVDPALQEASAGNKRRARSVSSSPVKERRNSMSQAGQQEESSMPSPTPPPATSIAPATKRRRLARTTVFRTESEERCEVATESQMDFESKESESKPTCTAPGNIRRPRSSSISNSSEAVPVCEPVISPAGRGRGGRSRLFKRGSPAKRGGRGASSVVNQRMMPPAISIPPPASGRWRGTAKSAPGVSSRSSAATATPASATALAAMAGHPYYRYLGELVKVRARPRNPHSRTSLAEMNRRAKLMLDWITRMQVERAEKLAQSDRVDKEEVVLARQRELTKAGEGKPRRREAAPGVPALIPPHQQPVLPAALDPRITPPLALADSALARNIASGADSSMFAAVDAPSDLAAAMKLSSDKTLELMDSLSRDVIKFQNRFAVKGRGG